MEGVRYFTVALPIAAALAVANEVAGYEFQKQSRILETELFLCTTGTGAGATTVDVKKNGTTILPSVISIASASATKRARKAVKNPVGEPSGVSVAAGDYVRADVTAVPGTTVPTYGTVYLHCCSEV
ncbi:hypothetical protein Acid345_3412 [Candidatus Koribacter versatilis Ellin345]|uniref:Uncharacterized protein n=1 Tax=Koribacter versatilis (strain Ellin345) TaxID=204669 RepID=Q1IL37_KORVE|nr:hypothetical protein [Candidatus Koribacter versatilis]ABF42413.1 hypothetical protein Acid345_3412 [Candidatus Koribacter versatilis Ellin345]